MQTSELNEGVQKRDWEKEAKLLYTTLSRLYGADNEEMDEAKDMAHEVLSEVSWDFRNEYAAHAWPRFEDIDPVHRGKKLVRCTTWDVYDRKNNRSPSEEILGPIAYGMEGRLDEGKSTWTEAELLEAIEKLHIEREKVYDNESGPFYGGVLMEYGQRNLTREDLVAYADPLETLWKNALDYAGQDTNKRGEDGRLMKDENGNLIKDNGIGLAKFITSGHFEIGLHHEGSGGWERLLALEIGEFFWTHEPFNGMVLWYRVQ